MVRGFSRDIWSYVAMQGAVGFAFFGVWAVLFNLFVLRLGYGPEFIGLLSGLGLLAGALVAFPAALVGRRAGPRAAIIGGLLGSALCIAMLLGVDRLPATARAGWLIGWLAASFVAAQFFVVNLAPYLMGVTTPTDRNHAFAVAQMAFNVMAVAGSLAAGLLPGLLAGWSGASLDGPTPYGLALWLAPLAYLLGAAAMTRTRRVTLVGAGPETIEAGAAPLRFFAFLAVVIFLTFAAIGARMHFFNVYLDAGLGVSAARIGAVMALGGVLAAAAPLATPLLVARIGTPRAIGLTTLGIAASLLLLGALPSLSAAALGFLGVGSLLALGDPARNIFGQEAVTPRWRTMTAAIQTFSVSLGWAAMALVGGRVIAARGYASLFFLASALAAMAGGAMLWYARAQARTGLPAPLVSVVTAPQAESD
jgi:MFS family permease